MFAGSKVLNIFEKTGKIENESWKEDMTIYVQDIKGFTSIKENVTTEELSQLYSDYISLTFDTIEKNKGYIITVNGDYILAYWDETISNSEIHAVNAFMEIKAKLDEWAIVGKSSFLPKLEIISGIVRGNTIIGIFGSQNKKYFALFGDMVNLVSRMCAANLEFKTQLLVTEKVSQTIQSKYQTKFIETVMIKGKRDPLKLFTVI